MMNNYNIKIIKAGVFKSFCFFILIFSISCSQSVSSVEQNKKSDVSTDTNHSSDFSELTKIVNKTDNKVDIFADSMRNELVATVDTGQAYTFKLKDNQKEIIYYLKYYVDIGINVPWNDTNSFIAISSSKEYEIIPPANIETSSAYIILQNESSTPIEFYSGASVLIPNSKTATIIDSKESSIFEIPKYSSTYCFENLPVMNIKKVGRAEEFKIQPLIRNFVQSNIYTILFDGQKLHLLNVAPFNSESKKKIWHKKNFYNSSNNLFSTDLLRTRYKTQNGSVICGVMKTNTKLEPYVLFIDSYGTQTDKYCLSVSTTNEKELKSISFCDILETTDEDFLFLIHLIYSDEDEYKIFRTSKDLSEIKWIFSFNDLYYENDWIIDFHPTSKGKLIQISQDKFAVCGVNYKFDEKSDTFLSYPHIGTIDSFENIAVYKGYNGNAATSENAESLFTSMIYQDGFFYVCGYENFDGSYPGNHKGVIYKIEETLPEDLARSALMYSSEKSLFLGIDTDSNENYYVCGEKLDSGNRLHGCYISKEMIDTDKKPVLFSSTKKFSYFNQICTIDNQVILSGTTTDYTDGKNPEGKYDGSAFVIATEYDGTKIWSNTFDNYTQVVSCMKNAIGSFLLHLTDENTNRSAIVSTDLLGRNSGREIDNFPQ